MSGDIMEKELLRRQRISNTMKRIGNKPPSRLGIKHPEFTAEHRLHMSNAHKKVPIFYTEICAYCKREFTKVLTGKKNTFCGKSCAQKSKPHRKLTKLQREAISKALRGRIPKNLQNNLCKADNNYRQYEMFLTIQKYFPSAVEQYRVRTLHSYRFLDVAIPELQIDFEYNGKCHLLTSVKERDKIRVQHLIEVGWITIVINRDNFSSLDEIVQIVKGYREDRKIKENGDVF